MRDEERGGGGRKRCLWGLLQIRKGLRPALYISSMYVCTATCGYVCTAAAIFADIFLWNMHYLYKLDYIKDA